MDLWGIIIGALTMREGLRYRKEIHRSWEEQRSRKDSRSMFFKSWRGRWAMLRGRACSAVFYAVERRQKVRTSIVYFGFSLNFSMDAGEQENPMFTMRMGESFCSQL